MFKVSIGFIVIVVFEDAPKFKRLAVILPEIIEMKRDPLSVVRVNV